MGRVGGWHWQEEKTFRPAQYLGWLKLLAAMGAEYYSVGYFNGRHPTMNQSGGYSCKQANCAASECCPFQMAQNYVWQLAMPAYAQATTSLWSDLLFDGELMVGDMPMARTSETCAHPVCDYSTKFPHIATRWPNYTHWLQPVNWRFWGGSQDVAIFVRKHKVHPGVYVVVGSVQPQSNYVGNTPVSVNATITLLQHSIDLTFEVRRQGSTYLLVTDAAARTVKSFVQLDGWHSSKHPSFWAAEFSLEAELHDGASSAWMSDPAIDGGSGSTHTENIIDRSSVQPQPQQVAGGPSGRQQQQHHYDLRGAVSFLRMMRRPASASHLAAAAVAAARFTWTFEPRPADRLSGALRHARTYVVVLRARPAARSSSSAAQEAEAGLPACLDLAIARNVRASHPQARIARTDLAAADPLGRACVSVGNGSGEWVECVATRLRPLTVATDAKHALVVAVAPTGPSAQSVEIDWLKLCEPETVALPQCL